jgi:hypothetical protein
MLDFFPWVNPTHARWNQGFFQGFCNVAKVGNHQENDFAIPKLFLNITNIPCTKVFFFQFCDVTKVAIIHKMI